MTTWSREKFVVGDGNVDAAAEAVAANGLSELADIVLFWVSGVCRHLEAPRLAM